IRSQNAGSLRLGSREQSVVPIVEKTPVPVHYVGQSTRFSNLIKVNEKKKEKKRKKKKKKKNQFSV
ncbi:hypothetical protein, partial [Acinetobacter baumannii]|uniref:hypothetical protein n=1 Tax=Acinetobacter baumannii TaxID=470 RepID=UPI001C075E82